MPLRFFLLPPERKPSVAGQKTVYRRKEGGLLYKSIPHYYIKQGGTTAGKMGYDCRKKGHTTAGKLLLFPAVVGGGFR